MDNLYFLNINGINNFIYIKYMALKLIKKQVIQTFKTKNSKLK